MIIAIENGLENLAGYLENEGYSIVSAESYRGAVDAYVYKNNGFYREGYTNNVLENNTGDGGILMVNVKNRTYAEIADVLKRRTYGEIF